MKKNLFTFIALFFVIGISLYILICNNVPLFNSTATASDITTPPLPQTTISEPSKDELSQPSLQTNTPKKVAQQSTEVEIQPSLGTSVWRDWISSDGLFFLELRTGVWNPNGTLFYLDRRGGVSLEGFQKGKNIKLKSFDAEIGLEAPPEYTMEGTLDTENNTFLATVIHHPDETERKIMFRPAIATTPKQPLLRFKYYGAEDQNTHTRWITRIDVIDAKNKHIIQTLDGFMAQAYMVWYLDLNYDGYFDLELEVGENVSPEQYIYFVYNPNTQRFEQDEFLAKFNGSPTRYPQKKQLNFGNGILYQKQGDSWQQVPCCYAD